MNEDELAGRLAALELVAAIALRGYSLTQAGSVAPQFLADKLEAAKAAAAAGVQSDAAKLASAAALDRIFARSVSRF